MSITSWMRIPLTQGKSAVVDAADFELVQGYAWQYLPKGDGYASANPYIKGSGKKGRNSKNVLMHRLIMGDPEGMNVDHEDGDGLNNRRSNLRTCTFGQNMFNRKIHKNNTSGYKGVYFDKRTSIRPYYATISAANKTYYLGWFKTPLEAAKAYNEGAIKHHGEFARLNEIKES